jgi:hypothetical protein
MDGEGVQCSAIEGVMCTVQRLDATCSCARYQVPITFWCTFGYLDVRDLVHGSLALQVRDHKSDHTPHLPKQRMIRKQNIEMIR